MMTVSTGQTSEPDEKWIGPVASSYAMLLHQRNNQLSAFQRMFTLLTSFGHINTMVKNQTINFLFYLHVRVSIVMTECAGTLSFFSLFDPLIKPSRCIKSSFYFFKNIFNFNTTKGFRTKNSMKLVYKYMAISSNF